jgi:protocatechuate 3,4-dioxygenase beta subunit
MSPQNKNISRREIFQFAFALGGLAVAGPVRSVLGQGAKRHLTAEQIMGPFYPAMKPLEADADLTMMAGRPGRAQGKVVELMGRVLDRNGEPVRGAKIEIWQANTFGRYAHASDTNVAPLDPNFQGYSLQTTDSDGRYRFKTIKPGAYAVNPTIMRPPHIHFDIAGRNDRLVTQMYFPDEPLNEKDILFSQVGPDKATLVGKILPPTKEVGPDSLLMSWDIVIDKG